MAYMHEDELNARGDTPAERLVYALTMLCSVLFILCAGYYLLGSERDGFALTMALTTGAVFIADLVMFFAVITRGR